MKPTTTLIGLLVAAVLAAPLGCSSAGIALKEQFGYAKREQLVDRVQEARDGQVAAKEQFESALAEFMAVTGAKGGELEAKHSKLKAQHDRCESRAATVRSRIAEVERVGEALFREWKSELNQYSDQGLRARSEKLMRDSRAKYDRLVGAMRAAESKMQPVLTAFKDQVLFLKQNLNAQAIASLQEEVGRMETDVSSLIKEMEASIAEANQFINQMEPSE